MNLTSPEDLAVSTLAPPAATTSAQAPALDSRTRELPPPVAGVAGALHDKRTRSRQYGDRRPSADAVAAMHVLLIAPPGIHSDALSEWLPDLAPGCVVIRAVEAQGPGREQSYPWA